VTHPLRLLQVGLGDWGRDWAWRVNPTVEEVEVVGYVDSDPSAVQRLHEKMPVPMDRRFASLAAAVEATRPEAVLVSTTLAGHEPLTRAALELGLHVLVEKPFTDRLDCARELVELAASRNLSLMVSQNYRHFPAPRVAAALASEGSLGDLYAITIDFRRNAASPPKPRRRHHSDIEPLLLDMSIHHFDLLRLVLQREPDIVRCDAQSPPWSGFAGAPAAVATIRFGGVEVSYRGSWISSGPITPWAGEWRMEFERGQIAWTSRGDRGLLDDRVVVRPRGGRPRAIAMPALEKVDRAGTLTEFATALREGREPETSGRDNLKTLAFTLGAIASSHQGGEPVRTHTMEVTTPHNMG
jgi:predicted dehydrogenase